MLERELKELDEEGREVVVKLDGQENYLSAISRVLKPEGNCLIAFF